MCSPLGKVESDRVRSGPVYSTQCSREPNITMRFPHGAGQISRRFVLGSFCGAASAEDEREKTVPGVGREPTTERFTAVGGIASVLLGDRQHWPSKARALHIAVGAVLCPQMAVGPYEFAPAHRLPSARFTGTP